MAHVSSAPQQRFAVESWAAWAPGLTDAAAWRRWALEPRLPDGDGRPELPEYPMLLRRRAERLARMALHTVAQVRGTTACPMVYASPRGETQRAAHLLRELAATASVAPGPFSLSVHNAVAALESIAHADTGNYIALAAGGESAELAIVEALGLLADGHDAAIVSVYDETMPDCYRADLEHPDAAYAWSWRLVRAGDGPGFELSWESLEPGHAASDTGPAQDVLTPDRDVAARPVSRAACPAYPALPPALRVLQFFLSDAESLSHDGSHCRWTWRRAA